MTDKLRSAGAKLANIAFILAQRKDLPAAILACLDASRKEWDEAVQATKAPVAPDEQPLIGKLLDQFSNIPVLWGLGEPGALVRHKDVFDMLIAASKARAALSVQAGAAPRPELIVWYGAMPESNGKSNFTATLMRKGGSLMDSCNYTFQVSEYPERVRYEADSMRYLIGEIDNEPCVLDYDDKKHSGYAAPTPPTTWEA